MTRVLAAMFFWLIASVACAQQPLDDLGTAPTGYTWFAPGNAGAAVLKPDGWFTRFESNSGTDALFVTKENIATSGRYETGLSLNLVHGVKGKTGRTASQYAIAFLAKALEGNEELGAFGGPSGDTLAVGLRFRNRKIDRVIHYYLIANDSRDTLHIFMFEAPSGQWDGAWKIGEPIFRNLRVIYPGTGRE